MLLCCGLVIGCDEEKEEDIQPVKTPETAPEYPKIANWLSKKNEIIESGKPFDLIMTAFVTPEEAASMRVNNPDMKIYAGLTTNWVYDGPGWQEFLLTVANYGREKPFEIKESMYLRDKQGNRCAFGWASEEWGHPEIWAMDPRNEEWVELITAFYKIVLEQPQHDGIIIDMVTEKSWCPESISDDEWVAATRHIMQRIQGINTENKPVIFNAGRDFSEIDAYSEYMDGYLMENFLGEQLRTTFAEGLQAAKDDYLIIYAVDTDDTGVQNLSRMRLGLTLSLLDDNTYFTYDIGPRDHGDAWWFPEYDADIGLPLGEYYPYNNGYRRDFSKGSVVCAPDADVKVEFGVMHMDITTSKYGKSFTVPEGDGRIFIKQSDSG